MKFRLSSVVIAVCWLYLIADAVSQGLALPGTLNAFSLPDISESLIYLFAAITYATSSAVTFGTRTRITEDMPIITRFMDKRWGTGAYADFNRRLRPVTLSIITSTILSGAGFYAVTEADGLWGYLLCAVFLAIAAGLFTALLISQRYQPRLY